MVFLSEQAYIMPFAGSFFEHWFKVYFMIMELNYVKLRLFSNSSKFHEFWWLFLKFNWDFYSVFFFKIRTEFCSVSFFLRPGDVFLYLFFCISEIMNVSFTALAVCQSRRFRKSFIDFSNNTFPIETGHFQYIFHYVCGVWFIIHNFNDRL